MIHLPFSKGTGAYTKLDNKRDIVQFIKRKRNIQTVIFSKGGDLLPCKCSVCGKDIKDESNRVDILPKRKLVAPKHYRCAWEDLLGSVFSWDSHLATTTINGVKISYINGKQV